MQWLCTKAKFAAMSTLIFVSFSLLPNLVYCFVRAQVRSLPHSLEPCPPPPPRCLACRGA